MKDLTGKANEKLDAISVTEEVSLPDGDIATAGNKPLDPDEEYIRSFEKGETPHLDRVKAMERYNKGGFLKHKPAYYEGMLWLAKTYVVREKFLDAGYYLRKLTEENGVPEHILREVPVVLADMSLRERNYDEAIVHLEEALNASKDKKLNARMAFILAQLYQTTNQNGKAYEAFDRVNDYKPNFDMSVSAQLNQLRNAWASGSDSSKDAIKKLEKMAKQAKYAQQLGMIYYSIAEIYLADGDEELALEYFNKSLTSGTNPASSSETYFRLAQLYLDKEEYLLAKNYFDSTLNVMTEKDERHPYVQKYSQSLTDIARQIDIITTNDSILVLADMQEDELIAWARKSAVKKLESEAEAAKSDPASGGFTATTSVLSGNSKFFAYNQTALQRGRSDFRRRWGNRPLEDDWRRSDKPSNLIESEEIEEQVEEISEEDVLKEIEKIIREVPREEEQIARVKDRVENALFQLGTGYRTYIQNYQKSNATLFTLRERFSETDKRLDSYYFNYLNYLDLEDEAQAQEYYNLILSRYPDSDYAKFLSNPTGDNVLVSDERRIEIYYEQTYDLFSNGNFTEANKRLIEAESKFGKDHDLIAKFDLLKAMCIGNLEGQKEYINALRGVILTHNNTPEQTHAREMLRFLRGDEEAFGGEVADEALEKFVSEDDKLHYVIVILYDGTGAKVNEAKKSINNYNNDNHKDARLRSTSIYLSQPDKTHLILIRRFQDKPTAMTYFKDIETNKKGFLNPDEYSYETFAINQKNYREVIKQKSVKSYRVFFENMYLGEVN